jgi:peptide deformylase
MTGHGGRSGAFARRIGLDSLIVVTYQIRLFGDPVLKSRAAPVTDIDGKVARLVDDMFDTLYESDNGLALAAPQIGVQKQIFVWDLGEDPRVVFNPEIVESSGEWVYEEGCLSIPGLYVEIARPKQVLLRGVDVDGNPVEWEADELQARMFQHELDHLNGVLMFDRMTPEQRREAKAEYRRVQEAPAEERAPRRRLRLR